MWKHKIGGNRKKEKEEERCNAKPSSLNYFGKKKNGVIIRLHGWCDHEEERCNKKYQHVKNSKITIH